MNHTPMAERRQRLLAQAAAQRIALAQDLEVWRKPLALADRGLRGLQMIKRHPAWIIAGVGLVAVLKPARVGRWLQCGWAVWRMLRELRER